MAKSLAFLQLIVLVFICILVINASVPGEALTCSDVNNDLLPCLSYITSGGKVPPGCCSGLKTLVSAAKTKTDRQTACSCLKSLAAKASDEQLKRAESIPKICGVKIPFKISRNVDCSKVNKLIGW